MKRKLIGLILSMIVLNSFGQEIDRLILNNENDKALQLIDREIENNGTQSSLWLKKGILLQKTFDYAGAIKALENAYQLDSTNNNVLIELAETHNTLGNYEDAVSYFEKAYSHDSTNAVTGGKLARAYINLKVYRKPFQILSNIYRSDSSNIYFNKQLAFCAYNIGADSLALALYNKVIEQNPRDISSYFNLSTIYQRKNKPEPALSVLEKGLTVFPENPGLLLKLANSRFEMKKYHEAVQTYELWLQKNDTLPDVRKSLGVAYYFEKREAEGLKLLESYHFLMPTDPLAAFYIGLCHKSLADYPQSIQYINFSIELSRPPYLSDIYHHLGLVYGLNRNFKEAIEALQKSYELDTTKNEILFEIATSYEEYQKDKAPAHRYYQAFLAKEMTGQPLSESLKKYAIDRIRKIEEDQFFEGKPVK